MKLLIAGYYGSDNIGDEALLEALVASIKHNIPGTELTAISADPQGTSAKLGIDAIQRFDYIAILSSIKQCDALVFGGGGLLQDITSRNSLVYYTYLIKTAKFLRKKVILLGQGIGPISDKRAVRDALKGVELVCVRDKTSADVLKHIDAKPRNIVQTADLGLLLKPIQDVDAKRLLVKENIIKNKAKLVGVSVRVPLKENADNFYKSAAFAFDELLKNRDVQLIFIPMQDKDNEAIENITSLMAKKPDILKGKYSPTQMMGMISVLDGLIGMRLHSLIFAAKTNVPCFGISYDPKVAGFMASVGQRSLPIYDITSEKLTSQLNNFIDRPDPVTGIKELEKLAAHNIVLLIDELARTRNDVLGVLVDDLTMDGAVSNANAIIGSGNKGYIVTPNPEIIVSSETDSELRDIMNNADIAPADGVGLMMAGTILGRPFKERVTGIDLMLKLIELSKKKGYRIFLYGSHIGVAEEAASKIGGVVVGTSNGFVMEQDILLQKINAVRPDIIFVGLGSSKQEKWAVKNLEHVNAKLIMCVGGSFDVIAGRVNRAPKAFQRFGLEWLYRLIKEPWRFKRMLVLPIFIIKVIKSRFS